MIALIPVRGGVLAGGGEEAIAEAGGRAILVGSGVTDAARDLRIGALSLTLFDADPFEAGVWAEALRHHLARLDDPIIILPASPDGRDLAPRLAHRLEREFYAGAITVTDTTVVLSQPRGDEALEYRLDAPCVVTLQPGVRGVAPGGPAYVPPPVELDLDFAHPARFQRLGIIEPRPETVSLSEARRIVVGGQGLRGLENFQTLGAVATMIRASVGGTRVAVDRGWLSAERQIGVTGLAVSPDLYIALGVSGAVQHLAAVTQPRHVIAVNTDATCPMMEIANLAIVADAPAVLDALHRRLSQRENAS